VMMPSDFHERRCWRGSIARPDLLRPDDLRYDDAARAARC
jgi:hypothetical protein